MKRKFLLMQAALIFICALLSYIPARASGDFSAADKYLNIVTNSSQPLSLDRLLYMALNDVSCQMSLTSASVRTGYAIANNGEADGVVAYAADLGGDYPNLVRVPAEIAQTDIYAVVRDGGAEVNNWKDLSGLRVGALSENLYIISKIPEGVELVTEETSGALLRMLGNGELDAAVISKLREETLALPKGVDYSPLLETQTNYLYLNKKRESLIPAVAKSIERMNTDGRSKKILNDIPVPELNSKKTIIHLISASSELAREEQFTASVRKRFEEDMSLEWYNVALDFRRFSRDPGRLNYIADRIRQDCASKNIYAIVVSGDVALEYIKEYYYLYFRNVPVFFYGAGEGYKEIMEGYERYVTGIPESIEAYESVGAALELFPETKRLYVLNDYTSEGVRYRKTIEEQLEPFSGRLEIEYNENLDCASILNHIKRLPPDSLVFVGSYFSDVNGQYYHLNEMKRLLEGSCSVPIISIHSTRPEYGAIGGRCLDYAAFGEIIADMLEKVLNGASVSEIPVVADSGAYNRWVFEKGKLEVFGISDSQLPKGAQIVNEIPSIWESDPWFATTLILLLVVGITGLGGGSYMIYRRRKRSAEKINEDKIKAVKERLERIIGTAPISVFISVDGVIADINENMRRDTGLDIGDYSIKIYDEPEERAAIVERVMNEGVIKNEIIKYKFADGTVHRCNTNFATAEYDGRLAIVAWMVDIEQSETQKDRIRDAGRSLQTVLDRMPAAVRITENESGTVAYANNTCLNMFGYSSIDSILGRLVTELTPPLHGSGEFSRDIIKKLLASETPVTSELDYLTADGGIIQTRVTACNIDYNGVKCTIAIITSLAEEKEIQRMRDTLQMILDFLPVPIRIADLENGTILYTNKAGAELFRVPTPEAVYGASLYSFMPEIQSDGERTVDKAAKAALSKSRETMEFTCKRADGEIFEAAITDCIIEYNGKRSSLGIVMDLTAEKEYRRMLENTAEKEREANQLKSRFLVNMSHEIRTPMNAIIGLTEIELHKAISSTEKEIYKKINISAKNLLDIINDILDLSKIEADKMELYEEEFELEGVVSSAMLVASPRLDGKNVEFMLNTSLELPRFIIGDRTRLWQILKNFLDNSAKYTDEGKISLSVFGDENNSHGDVISIVFIIEDTGIGIDEEQMKRIFRPYEQIYNDAQRKYTGTGLGLAISKQLCELMGGSMEVQSNLGSGTSIRLNIPFKRSSNKESSRQMIKAPALSGVNVLAVDDSKLSLSIMENLLKSNDVNCDTAQSGAEAIDMLIASSDAGKNYDVILLDYMMDGMNGLETARQIHLAMSKSPKLLMVTAYQKQLLRSELEKNGIDDILEKPFIPSQFIGKLCAVLNYEEIAEEAASYTMYKGAHVLLCEDYPINQEVATGMFAQFGVTASVAEDGKKGLELLYSGEKFDLIFMDLKMPVMDGYEATRVIRADKSFDNIPIISLTADAMKEIVEKCLEIGMNDHVAKPIEFESLDRVFKKWLPESKRVSGISVAMPAEEPESKALARFGGKRERYEKALLEFAKMLPDEWPEFAAAMENSEKIAFDIHKLKGAAGNLDENEIYEYATGFERTMRASQPDEALYNSLVSVCTTAKNRITERFAGKTEQSLPEGAPRELDKLLEELADALGEYDPRASVAAVQRLAAKAWPGADAEKLRRISELTQKYEFDAALQVIREVK